jgi:uncharacterized phage-associated protein
MMQKNDLHNMMQIDLDKIEQVLHYIIHEVGHLPHAGKTVLFKLLYFCDFDYYEMHEEFLTGEQYRKLDYGPVPLHFDETIEKLRTKEKILDVQANFHGHPQVKCISLNEPDVSLLSAKEIETINETLERLSSMNATQISAYSHLDIPWKVTEDKEVIDYELVFYRDPLTSVREYE